MNITELFSKIFECNSMTAIDAILEQNMEVPCSLEEAENLLKIYQSNDLDKRHLICAQVLGMNDEIDKLNAWIEIKGQRVREAA